MAHFRHCCPNWPPPGRPAFQHGTAPRHSTLLLPLSFGLPSPPLSSSVSTLQRRFLPRSNPAIHHLLLQRRRWLVPFLLWLLSGAREVHPTHSFPRPSRRYFFHFVVIIIIIIIIIGTLVVAVEEARPLRRRGSLSCWERGRRVQLCLEPQCKLPIRVFRVPGDVRTSFRIATRRMGEPLGCRRSVRSLFRGGTVSDCCLEQHPIRFVRRR